MDDPRGHHLPYDMGMSIEAVHSTVIRYYLLDAMIDRFGTNVEVIENRETGFPTEVEVTVNHVFFSFVFGFGGGQDYGPGERARRIIEIVDRAMTRSVPSEGEEREKG